MERVHSFIQLSFCIFLYGHHFRLGYGLNCDSLPILTRVFISMSESLVVDRVYRSCDCPLGRVKFLDRFGHFSYGIYGVVWESRSMLLVLHARPYYENLWKSYHGYL